MRSLIITNSAEYNCKILEMINHGPYIELKSNPLKLLVASVGYVLKQEKVST